MTTMEAPVDTLKEQLRGTVITPQDEGYNEARAVYNGMIDRKPAVLVHCANAGDVISAIAFARANNLEIAVRGGGHSAPGFGTTDGGLVIDLSGMRGVRVDPIKKTARAEGGATWGDFNAATYAFGLATTGGIISSTGVAGLTLGGGIGYLARGFGLSCDNLLSADVVTADGRFLIANENENADLFWALRGGGGNFGVCTSLEFQLHDVKDVYAGFMFFELSEAANVLKAFNEYMKTAPEQLGAFPAFQVAPPLPFIPEARHGETLMAIIACWAGPLDQGEAAFRPFHEIAPVVAEMVGPMPYPALNSAFDALLPAGLQHYWKGHFAKDITPAVIQEHVEHGAKIPTMNSAMHIYPINGACHRVASDATAFNNRDASFATVIAGMWPDPADNNANVQWVRDYYNATTLYSEPGGYINFMDADEQDRLRATYGGNYDRLVEVKRKYDPENVFHLNQNIKP